MALIRPVASFVIVVASMSGPVAGESVLQLTQLTSGTSPWHSPAWSPDGLTIAAIHRDSTGNEQIWTIPAAGGLPLQITTTFDGKANPFWSPDGSKIGYIRWNGRSEGIWWAFSSGGDITPVVEDPDGLSDTQGASWSPNGAMIAYDATVRSNGSASTGIWVVPWEGGTPRRLTANSYFDWAPQWSLDGGTIYFVRDDEHVSTVPATGGAVTPLTWLPPFRVWRLSVTDGKIAFCCDYPTGSGEIYTVPSIGGALSRVTPKDSGGGCEPSWSPDGQQIVFSSWRDRSGNQHLWIASQLPTTAVRQTTFTNLKSTYR